MERAASSSRNPTELYWTGHHYADKKEYDRIRNAAAIYDACRPYGAIGCTDPRRASGRELEAIEIGQCIGGVTLIVGAVAGLAIGVIFSLV